VKGRFSAWLDRWGWLLLLAASPFLLFPSPERSLALLVVPLVLWGQLAGEAGSSRRTPLDVPILLMAVMVLVSLYATYDIGVSLPKIAGMVLGIGAFYETVRYCRRSPRHLAGGVGLFLLLGSGFAAAALLTTRWPERIGWVTTILAYLPQRVLALPGAEGGVQHNEAAGVMLWVSPLAIGLAARWWVGARHRPAAEGGGWGWGGLAIGAALLTTAVLVLAQSRGGLLSFGAALLVLMGLGGQRTRAVGIIGGGAALLTLLVGLLVSPVLLGELLVGTPAQVEQISSLDTLAGRVEIWSRAVYAIQDFPLTGVGMNVFRKIVPALYPLFLISPTFDIAHAHNTWLQAALDLGLPGLVAYLAVWLAALVMLGQVLRRSQDAWLRTVSLSLLASQAGHFIYGLTDTIALGAKPGLLWWILLALVVVVWQQAQESADRNRTDMRMDE